MDPRSNSTCPAGDRANEDDAQAHETNEANVPNPSGEGQDSPSDAPVSLPTERIFPIRSMLSVTPSTSSPNPDLASPTRGPRHYSIVDQQTWDQIRRRASSNPSPPNLTSPSLPRSKEHVSTEHSDEVGRDKRESAAEGYITSRFRHIVTPAGHAILTGRGAPVTACEDEPIHIPGAIQSFGLLLAFREVAEGQFHVHVASENSEALLGYSPTDLFSLHNFCDLLPEEQCDQLLDHVDFIQDEGYDPTADGPDVFILAINHSMGRPVRFWCAIHINPTNRDLIICELEPEDDLVNPPNIADNTSPLIPSDTLGFDPTPEAVAESTINISQPLRVLRSARRRRGEEAAMQVFSIVSQVQDQLGRAENLDVLLNTTVGLVKELTGFHRVMVYQFDPDWNGMVVAELVDTRMTKDLYKGLRWPASDLPKQARDLYRINRVRLLYDRDQLTARLVCRSAEDLATPLDMTHAYLRAMSPIHVKYLANMAVRASMSISINGFDGLWGLISCHGYGTSGRRVSFPIRKMCRLIGDTVARNVERLSYASRLQARTLINTMPTDANPSGYIIASSDDLLKLFDADYAALTIRGETKLLGSPHDSHEILALVEFLKIRRLNSVLSTQNVTKDFPDLHYAPTFKSISGMLYVPLSTDGVDFMTFFRRGQLTEIKWGGNPHEKRFDDGNLEPRKSFQIWKETVLDQSRQWTHSEIETAAILCLVYGKFIKVWRQNEANSHGSQLTKLLLANSAHEVRTPLNAIINYLEIALEGTLDKDTRENLSKSYSASKSLIYVINDLLDLTNAEKSTDLIKDDTFDLLATFNEATEMFEYEAKRKEIYYTVTLLDGVPKVVVGDQRRVRQALSNLISNAIQHTTTGSVTVEMSLSKAQTDNDNVIVEISVVDTGSGMSQDTVELLFRELEQVSGAEDESTLRNMVDKDEKKVLGLGLAFIARMVHNHHGQLSVRSEEGKGSHFKVSLQFSIPDRTELPEQPSSPSPRTSMIEPSGEEFVLVDSKAPRRKEQGDSQYGSSGQEGQTVPSEFQTHLSVEETTSTAASGGLAEETQRLALNDSAGQHAPASVGEAVSASTGSHAIPIEQPSESKLTPEHEAAMPTAPAHSTSITSTQHPLYRVLVAEDDPINGKIIEKRLGKLGHSVHLTVNGEECTAAYRADPTAYDVVLMDIQMPIVDGMAATRMFRNLEKESSPALLSDIAKLNNRIPIFAVSASLLEKDASLYIENGFDGWIMKPINFQRLNTILEGLRNADTRHGATYQPGKWENGGWFTANMKG